MSPPARSVVLCPETPHHARSEPKHWSSGTLRPALLTTSRLILPLLGWAGSVAGFPLHDKSLRIWEDIGEGKDPKDPSLWVYLGTAVALVLLGGAFAGLTIA